MTHEPSPSIPEEQLDAAALLAAGLPPVQPPARLRERLMAATAPAVPNRILPGFEEALPGFAILRSGRRQWSETPFPGVHFITLAFDRQTSLATNLLRLQPGAVYPQHHHSQGEQCWVLEGVVRHADGSLVAHAGDFFAAQPGSDHTAITSEQGCLLLIVSSVRDYVR